MIVNRLGNGQSFPRHEFLCSVSIRLEPDTQGKYVLAKKGAYDTRTDLDVRARSVMIGSRQIAASSYRFGTWGGTLEYSSTDTLGYPERLSLYCPAIFPARIVAVEQGIAAVMGLEYWPPIVEPIETAIWAPSTTAPGMIRRTGYRRIRDVLADLNARLEGEGIRGGEGGFSHHGDPAQLWPRSRWIVGHAVTGSNEGHYVHVGVVWDDPRLRVDDARLADDDSTEHLFPIDPQNACRSFRRYEILGLCKTFCGMEVALQIAAAATKHLGG